MFSWQLYVNYLQQGSIFSSPYRLHQEYDGGRLALKYFANISHYYFKVEGFTLFAALSSLLFIRDATLRRALVFWFSPTFLFFCCFNFIGYPYRFFLPIFPAMAAALVCSDIWESQYQLKKRYLFAAIILFLSTPLLPLSLHFADFFQTVTSNWQNTVNFIYRLRLILAIPLWGAALFYFRRDHKLCLALLIFGILITEYSHWLMVALVVGMLIHSCLGWLTEIFPNLKRLPLKR